MDISHISEAQYSNCLSASVTQYPYSQLMCTHTHTPPVSSMLRNLLACQQWKTWKRSSARVHHALNVLLAAHTFGEQSRYYFKTIPVNSGMHYLIYNHVNDSTHAISRLIVVPVSMDSVTEENCVSHPGNCTSKSWCSYSHRSGWQHDKFNEKPDRIPPHVNSNLKKCMRLVLGEIHCKQWLPVSRAPCKGLSCHLH